MKTLFESKYGFKVTTYHDKLYSQYTFAKYTAFSSQDILIVLCNGKAAHRNRI